jgi:hypothetical protein
MTGEPLQPVRLYYSIPNKVAARRIFLALRCMVDEGSGAWLWHYEEEVSALTFARPRHELPEEVHPIILGRFRFPSKDKMILAVRSGERAIEAAKFFAPLFGEKIVLRRVRVINRYFEASESEGGLDHLDKLLDANVVRIDPQDAEDAIKAAVAGARTQEEKQRAFFAYHEAHRKKDIPLVEDLPLHPEEETPDFRDLMMTIRLRSIRAFHHWKGNKLTLGDVIDQVVQNGTLGLPGE